uniref:Uncharacterized protein n=1 Tax=Lygus hesperus TaxID=30085 RepID=A0A146LLA2_LYGHE
MKDRGLLALAQTLPSNHTLRVLNVSYNRFTTAAAEAFAVVLPQNTNLIACHFCSTSISHQTKLQVNKVLHRNEVNLQNAEPSLLHKELIRLHFQKYKLDEARNELEGLRDKSAGVKHASEHFELQCKQDKSDSTRRIRELQEQ